MFSEHFANKVIQLTSDFVPDKCTAKVMRDRILFSTPAHDSNVTIIVLMMKNKQFVLSPPKLRTDLSVDGNDCISVNMENFVMHMNNVRIMHEYIETFVDAYRKIEDSFNDIVL